MMIRDNDTHMFFGVWNHQPITSEHLFCSYGHLSIISTYNPIYRMYNPIYNQL